MNTKNPTGENNNYNNKNIFGKLTDRKSNPLIDSLYKYINEEIPEMIKQRYLDSIEKISININDYILKKTHEFAKIWNIQFANDKQAFIDITDAFENLISKSLYDVIIGLDNNEKCQRYDNLLTKFSFLTLKHLQIDFNVDEFDLSNKLQNLAEIGISKSPKEKCIIVSNFCNYLKMSYDIKDSQIFLRIVVFCLIKLNTPNIYRNIKYTYYLRNKLAIDSDDDYYVSLFYSAFEFLEKLNYKKLNINKNEYQSFVDEYEKKELIKNNKLNQYNTAHENKLLNILNKTKGYSFEESEKSENIKNSLKINGDSGIDGILNMNTEKLYNDYLSGSFNDISLLKFENMHNDMKIILKMIEAQKTQMNFPLSPQNNITNSNHSQKENGINIIDL